MGKTRDTWILLVVVAVLAVGFLTLVRLPQSRRLSEAHAEIARESEELARDTERAACIPGMVRDVKQLERQHENFDQRLPRRRELAEFLKEIARAGESEDLIDREITQGREDATHSLYTRLPITMHFTTDYSGLVGFLGQLRSMPRLARVEHLEVRPARQDGRNLRVDMQVNIYFSEG